MTYDQAKQQRTAEILAAFSGMSRQDALRKLAERCAHAEIRFGMLLLERDKAIDEARKASAKAN